MTYPDANGQYYHPTPTPAAMGNYGQQSYMTPSVTSLTNNNNYEQQKPESLKYNYDQNPWHKSNQYYGSKVGI